MTFEETFKTMDKQDITPQTNPRIKIETLEIAGMASVLKALRLPFGLECRSEVESDWGEDCTYSGKPIFSTNTKVYIHEKDLHLLSILVKRGDAHAKVLRGLIVYAEIEAPVYWWVECETHRYGHERLSSSSTMHCDCKGLSGEELVKAKSEIPMGKMMKKIDFFSYQALRNIYKLRKDHRLPEWREFCEWVESLPFFSNLIMPE